MRCFVPDTRFILSLLLLLFCCFVKAIRVHCLADLVVCRRYREQTHGKSYDLFINLGGKLNKLAAPFRCNTIFEIYPDATGKETKIKYV